jgi:LacI family transcriptional regulator
MGIARGGNEMRQPTMNDVAARANVGVGTVSRVVNGGASVRPQTAARVHAAIAELGFRRNDIARALRPGMRSKMLALLLGDLTNPFYATIAKTAVEVARAEGYAVVVATVDEDPSAEERVVQDLVDRRIAGLMLVPDRHDHAFLAGAIGRGTAVVFVDRPAAGVPADVVLLDNDRGGYVATRHLLERGYQRIAVLIAPSYYTTGQRTRGYRRALRDAGVCVDERLVITLPEGSPDAARAATAQLLALRNPPTAIFATTNFVCEGAVRALNGVGLRVAVVGFDDFPLADLLPMPATTVSGDVAEMGRRATRMLLDRIGGDAEPPRREVIPVQLTTRGSGELAARR